MLEIPTSYTKKILSITNLLLGIALLLTLWAYIPSFSAHFVNWDDDEYVVQNTMIRSFGNWKDLLLTDMQGNYHPLTMFSLAVNYAISGEKAWSYHTFNILLHLLNVLLVFVFIQKITGGKYWIAFITAVLFGIHPMHVESVAWITERKDVLYACFFLLGLSTYWEYLQTKSLTYFSLTFLCLLLSLLSKPAAVVFPIVLLLLDYYKGREKQLEAYWEKIPFFLLAAAFAYLTYTAQKAQGSLVDTTVISRFYSIFFGFYAIMMYFVKAAFPSNLSTFHPFPETTEGLSYIYYLSPLFSLFLLLCVLFLWKKNRNVVWSILFYLVNLLLVCQFLSIGSAVISERYTYIPYIGLFFLLGQGIQLLIEKSNSYQQRIVFFMGIVSLLFLTYLCREQVKTWQDGGTLWEQAIRAEPTSRACVNRALISVERNKLAEAIYYYTKAVHLAPYDYEALCSRGNIYYDLGMNSLAFTDYKASLAIQSDYHIAWDNLGALYVKWENPDSAIACFSRAIASDSSYLISYYNRAVTHLELKNYDLALADFNTYNRKNDVPDADVLNSIALCYQDQKAHTRAIIVLDSAIHLKEHPTFYLNRAFSLASLGKQKEAAADVQKAAEWGEMPDSILRGLLQGS